ncbi:hypothetical protein DIPPA_04542 [Diplonema papillatum]|nr:hypothetical protein DIPPA_04542 [Diplonema papillatum]
MGCCQAKEAPPRGRAGLAPSKYDEGAAQKSDQRKRSTYGTLEINGAGPKSDPKDNDRPKSAQEASSANLNANASNNNTANAAGAGMLNSSANNVINLSYNNSSGLVVNKDNPSNLAVGGSAAIHGGDNAAANGRAEPSGSDASRTNLKQVEHFFDTMTPPPGMSKHGHERVCTWLLSCRDPPDDGCTWLDSTASPEPPLSVADIEALTLSGLNDQDRPSAQSLRSDDPLLKRCIKEYDTLRMNGMKGLILTDDDTEVFCAVKELLVTSTLRAMNPCNWLHRILTVYLGQDPTAVQSCTIALELLENGKYEEDDLTKTHRHVFLIKDFYDDTSLRPILREAVANVVAKMLPNFHMSNGAVTSAHLSPQASHVFNSSSSIQILTSRSRGRENGYRDSREAGLVPAWTLGHPTPTAISNLKENEQLVWQRRALSGVSFANREAQTLEEHEKDLPGQNQWTNFDFDISQGPTVSDLGYEFRARAVAIQTSEDGQKDMGGAARTVLPPHRIRMTENVMVALLSSIASEYAKVQCNLIPEEDVEKPQKPDRNRSVGTQPTSSLTIKPRELVLTIDGVKSILGSNVSIAPHTNNEVGFTISEDRGMKQHLKVTKQLAGERVALIALVRLFTSLRKTDVTEHIMGAQWGEWPSGNKQQNVTLLSRSLSYEPPPGTTIPSEYCEQCLVLLAIKHEWMTTRALTLLKKLCSNINIEVPPTVTLPEGINRTRSGLSVNLSARDLITTSRMCQNSARRLSEYDDSPSHQHQNSSRRAEFEASGSWRTGGNAMSYATPVATPHRMP